MTEIAANKGVKREERILKNGAYAHEPVQWHRRDRPCDVGAPHQRKRVFIVAYADGDGRNAEQFQSGKSGETLDKAPKREFGGTGWLYGGIPDANGYGVGQFGEQKEIEKVRRREDNKRRRAKENAIGRWWQTEPDVGRVVTRCPHRVDRLRGLGNMVVPAQIYPLFEVIAEIERGDENA